MSSHTVVVGLDPDRKEKTKVILATRGWEVVDGDFAPGALKPTVYFTLSKPLEVMPDIKVFALGETISKDATPELVADLVGLPVNTAPIAPVVVDDVSKPLAAPVIPEPPATPVIEPPVSTVVDQTAAFKEDNKPAVIKDKANESRMKQSQLLLL